MPAVVNSRLLEQLLAAIRSKAAEGTSVAKEIVGMSLGADRPEAGPSSWLAG